MNIRTFQAGDDLVQVSIYNDAAGNLPRFKAATVDEIRRRLRGSDFSASSRFYAISEGRPVGYITFAPSGRISYPWCRKGYESAAETLLDACLDAMRKAGHTTAFAAYRTDWPGQVDFFTGHGFTRTREMVNFVLDIVEMPTPAARFSSSITPVTVADIPAMIRLGSGILRSSDPAIIEECYFRNPYFKPSSLFALRSKVDDQPVAVGILVEAEGYADPKQVDSGMPCFRLGAFGTERLTHKRINGLFSLLAADTRDLSAYALDMLGYATRMLEDSPLETLAGQVPSDVPHLMRLYKSLFRQQGSFPILERRL